MAVRNDAYTPVTDCGGTLTNPTLAGSVMADTGVLTPGIYDVRVFVGCSVAAAFTVQHRDGTNSSNLDDVSPIRAAAGQTGQYLFRFNMATLNERVRVIPAADITGNAEVTIQAIRVA